jgi:hypothetical protein
VTERLDGGMTDANSVVKHTYEECDELVDSNAKRIVPRPRCAFVIGDDMALLRCIGSKSLLNDWLKSHGNANDIVLADSFPRARDFGMPK